MNKSLESRPRGLYIVAMRSVLTLLLFSVTIGYSQRITGYLRYQTEIAWKYDDARRKTLENIRDEKSLLSLKADIKNKVLSMIGGLPSDKTPLNAKIGETMPMNGFHIEKLIFESLPGYHVTALVYVPENDAKQHPAILVACGHSPNGKIHYQALCQRLVQRGYLVICWDPVGQGERSQFWDNEKKQSRYNLVCGEHAVLGNLAYLAGANLMRWEIWDGIRAVDYLLTRNDVDANRISITGTSGGGAQAAHIGALDERIKVVAPSCYISLLPMRAYNRSFADPDSDPEQDLPGMISEGVDHAGLLLLVYPRPLFIASAVLDFFPIEGTRKTFREVSDVYERFGHERDIAMAEGYHTHSFSVENQEAAINFIDRFNQQPKQNGLPPVTDIDAEKLLCTKEGQVTVAFKDEKKLTDIIKSYFGSNQSHKGNTVAEMYFGNNYPGIRSWTLEWEKIGQFTTDGMIVDRYIIHHSKYLRIPVSHFHSPTSPGKRTTLWLDINGNKPDVQKGEDIISFDFRGVVENKDVDPLSSALANYVYNSLLVGRPYFLQMIEDTEITLRFVREQLGIKEVVVSGTEESRLLQQQVAATLQGVSYNDNEKKPGLSWSQILNDKLERWPISYLLPGGAYIR